MISVEFAIVSSVFCFMGGIGVGLALPFFCLKLLKRCESFFFESIDVEESENECK